MIQDIAPSIFHNEFRSDATLQPDSPVICFDGRKLLHNSSAHEEAVSREGADDLKLSCCVENNQIYLPTSADLGISEKQTLAAETIYGFAIDNTEYFIYIGSEPLQAENYIYEDIRDVRKWADNVNGMIAFTGYHLCQWYKDSRYCGRCGSRNIHHNAERAMHCPVCDRNIYPRIMPAVIIGVINRDRILLTKYRDGFNNYALVAGFTEIGETLEETVAREVMEEVGLQVRNIRYYKSQPWGLANDILMGFFCDVDGSDEIHMDKNELKLAQWTSREDIILHPDSFSLTNAMMQAFKESRPV